MEKEEGKRRVGRGARELGRGRGGAGMERVWVLEGREGEGGREKEEGRSREKD